MGILWNYGKRTVYFVYLLKDPITNEICYVGATTNLKVRKSRHINNPSFASHYYAFLWGNRIQRLRDVDMRIVYECNTKEEMIQREKDAIQWRMKNGDALVNSNHFLTAKKWNQKKLAEIFERTAWYQDEVNRK